MIASKKTRVLNIVKMTVLYALFVLYMIPFVVVIINSFKQKINIIRTPLQLLDPEGLFIKNYIDAIEQMNYLRGFFNSFLITSVSVLVIILFASLGAYYFARSKTFGSRISFAAIVAAMVIPFQTIMIPIVSIYGNELNMLNSRATLIFMYSGFGMALAIFIYYGFIKSGVPISIEEAALIDGCKPYQVFFRIVFPLLKPTTATIAILDVLWIWNDYLLPSLVLGDKEMYTLPLSTYAFYGTFTSDLGKIMASLVLTIIPVIIVYIVLQKHIIAGVLAGAVKS